jgi:hypothetical protein
MSNAIYPAKVRGLTYSVTKTPEFSTVVQRAVSAAEIRIPNWQNPIWHWDLIYDYLWDDPGNIAPGLTQTDLRTLMGFYMSRQGMFDSFLYSDPNDNTVTTDDQTLQVVVSGGTSYVPIQRAMGPIGAQFYEDVTDLDGPIQIFDNAVLQAPVINYNIIGPGVALDGFSFEGLVAQWVGTPTGPITANFGFFFRVKFDTDKVDFEEFVNKLWTLGGGQAQSSNALKLVSARVPLA